MTEPHKQVMAEAISSLYELFQEYKIQTELKATVEINDVSYDVSFKPSKTTNHE